MQDIVKLVKDKLVYVGAVVLGALAVISYTVPQLSDDLGDNGFDDSQFTKDTPKEISNQIDENTQKLKTMEASSESNSTDYRVLGC